MAHVTVGGSLDLLHRVTKRAGPLQVGQQLTVSNTRHGWCIGRHSTLDEASNLIDQTTGDQLIDAVVNPRMEVGTGQR